MLLPYRTLPRVGHFCNLQVKNEFQKLNIKYNKREKLLLNSN